MIRAAELLNADEDLVEQNAELISSFVEIPRDSFPHYLRHIDLDSITLAGLALCPL